VSVRHPNCRKLFQIEDFHQQVSTQENDDMEMMYRSLSEELPPTAVDQGMEPLTKLQVMKGTVPYLPCRIQLYDVKQLRRCLHLRHSNARNNNGINDNDSHNIKSSNITTTWLAFAGDSKMRDKFVALVFGLRSDFNWTISWDAQTNGEYVPLNMEDLEEQISKTSMNSMRVVSTDGLLQVDFVSATLGLNTVVHGIRPVPLLRRWAATSEDLPHLIVIGHGMWTFAKSWIKKQPLLDSYDEVLENWKETADVLVSLAARTNVLVWPQNRKRILSALDHIRNENYKIFDILVNAHGSRAAQEWIEKAMHESMKNTGLIQWDSSVPFNRANIRECEAIREVLHRTNDGDDSTASGNYVASGKRKKRRDQGEIMKQTDMDNKTMIERKYKDNTTAIEEIYKQTRSAMEEKKKKRFIKKKLGVNLISVNEKISTKDNDIDTNKSLGRQQIRNREPNKSVKVNYKVPLNISLNNSLNNRKLDKLTVEKMFYIFDGTKSYHKYIDYILVALKTMPFKDLESLYDSPILSCNDALHSTKSTIQDEIYMIYNLLCNQYEPKQDDLCCQM
ncbi:unnamed protein product, partial [Meganyctiphanes norvegica]